MIKGIKRRGNRRRPHAIEDGYRGTDDAEK